MEPDFKALAEAWVANDPRMQGVAGDRKEALIGRIAEALSRRRGYQKEESADIGLIVNVDRDHFRPGQGLSSAALDKLTELVQERIDSEPGV